jgi:hypothetical protein
MNTQNNLITQNSYLTLMRLFTTIFITSSSLLRISKIIFLQSSQVIFFHFLFNLLFSCRKLFSTYFFLQYSSDIFDTPDVSKFCITFLSWNSTTKKFINSLLYNLLHMWCVHIFSSFQTIYWAYKLIQHVAERLIMSVE